MEELQGQLESLTISKDPEVQWLHQSVLGKNLKLILNDTREITGRLQCVDHLANIVLLNASELFPSINITRTLGNIIVPIKGVNKILLQA
ncbi:hypothetical protein SteCoe_18005 [Stentor coeruleus]|uniref:Sm domain-containing protein n=1 Tax=Stentor coeruleus TaxID=5963 RepID=A0A1R2BXN7_9CILI|nr:hypothetical protein SteCoe_18005 [Stentor coeruleus]